MLTQQNTCTSDSLSVDMLKVRSSRSAVRSLLAGIRYQSTKVGMSAAEDWTINPLEFGEEHVSQVYCVPSGDVKTVFPTSLPRFFSTQTSSLGETCWILRRESYNIMNELKSFDKNQQHNFRYLLYGADGSGKTICLHQVLHYCVKAGWLVVFVPGVFSWTHSDRELRPSTRVPGTYDQPDAASTWLKAFRTLNSHFTAQLQLSRDRQWGKKDHSLAGDEINKIIDMGLLKPVLATDVVVALLEELVLASGRFKMMLAVDELNGCVSPTTLRNQTQQWVGPEQLNLVRCLLQHIPQFPGAVLLSLSRSRMLRCSAPGWKPHQLLDGESVSESMRAEAGGIRDSCRAVEISPYTRLEMERCLDYYSQKKWITTELSQTVLNELWHLTSGCPQTLQKMCASL